MAGPTPTQAPYANTLESAISRLKDVAHVAGSLSDNASAIRNKLGGSVPEAVAGQPDAPTAPGMIGSVHALLDKIDNLLSVAQRRQWEAMERICQPENAAASQMSGVGYATSP